MLRRVVSGKCRGGSVEGASQEHSTCGRMGTIRKVAIHILFISVYGFTWLVAVLGRAIPRRPWKPTGRIMVTGTFFNPNWYLSHVTPLARSGVQEVILVVDEPQLAIKGVRFICPPTWVARLLGRSAAKAIWMIVAGIRYRPDLYMGYHLAPGACSALVAGKLFGRPSCFQMTGGPVGLEGGGYAAIDSIEGTLGRPSNLIEALSLAVVRQFDLVVVRGNKTKEYLKAHDIRGPTDIITGSVRSCMQPQEADRDIHLSFVGRLVPVKQVEQFIEIVEAVGRVIPSIRAVIVGDGPLMAEMKEYASRLGIMNNVEFLGKREDVETLLACSKVFVLTSISEGMSIAMAEAMRAGVVPVVANIGELSDLVADGVNGYLIEPNMIDKYAQRAISLLSDEALWTQFSGRAREAARKHCGIEAVTEKWRRSLGAVILAASGCNPQE